MKTRMRITTKHPGSGRTLVALLLALLCGIAECETLPDWNVEVVANRGVMGISYPPVILGSSLEVPFLPVFFGPFHGTLFGASGYLPNQDFVGTDQFRYVARKSDGLTYEGRVVIRVKNGLIISNASITEGNIGTRTANFAVNLTAPASEFNIVTVGYRTFAGTALAGSDYLHTTGTLTFGPGIRTLTIAVPVLSDLLFEPSETFSVQLINPTTNTKVLDGVGLGTIFNYDGSLSRVGTAAFAPADAVVEVGEPVVLHLSWTHPVGWRQLDSIDLLIVDDEEAVLPVRWHEAENHFSLYKPANDRFVRTARAGSPAHFETSAATLFLEESTGGGPPGQTVVIRYGVIFKPQAAGRTFRVETSAKEDAGNRQAFEQVGTITVLPD